MPTITIDGKAFDAPEGKRLVLAIEDAGIPILHRCGGYARCTTCRVKFTGSEPHQMTDAEKKRLQEDLQPLYGSVRLSCQILCEQDMAMSAVMTLNNSDMEDPGKRPEDHITPAPSWTAADYLD